MANCVRGVSFALVAGSLLLYGSLAASASESICQAPGGEQDLEIARRGTSLMQRKKARNAKHIKKSAIVVIDMQNDFAHRNGALSASGANAGVVHPINKLLGLDWGLRVFTADNHPQNHISFTVNQAHTEVIPNGAFPIVQLHYSAMTSDGGPKLCGAEYVEKFGEAAAICNSFPTARGNSFSRDLTVPQETYPVHCVQGSWGQKIVDTLDFSYKNPKDILVLKGQNAHIDSYSAVFNNLACNGTVTQKPGADVPNTLPCIPSGDGPYPVETNLPDLLRVNGVKNVYFVGLCLDYCVKYSSIHTAFLGKKTGWNTYVIPEASAFCHPSKYHQDEAEQQMLDAGVNFTTMASLMH